MAEISEFPSLVDENPTSVKSVNHDKLIELQQCQYFATLSLRYVNSLTLIQVICCGLDVCFYVTGNTTVVSMYLLAYKILLHINIYDVSLLENQ